MLCWSSWQTEREVYHQIADIVEGYKPAVTLSGAFKIKQSLLKFYPLKGMLVNIFQANFQHSTLKNKEIMKKLYTKIWKNVAVFF